MDGSDEYYIYLHVDGKFVRDPFVMYEGGEVVKLKEDPDTISYFEVRNIVENVLNFNSIKIIYFHEPFSCHLQDNLRVLWDDTSTIAMLNYWMKYGFIDIYVEHKVDNLIIVDDILLLHGAEGSNEFRGDAGDNVTEGAGDIVGEGAGGDVSSEIDGETVHEGVHGDVVHEDAGEVATQGASEVLTEGVATDVVYEGANEDVHEEDVEAVNAIHEGTDGATKTVNECVSVNLNDDDKWLQQSQMEGAVEVIGKGVHEGAVDGTETMNEDVATATDELQPTVAQQNFYESESKDAYSEDGVYLMKFRYLSDGNDDGEL
ncbi:hypothetical protein V6N13_148282 [Hibiscus sabdariffa]|uniref:PB1-like domain-containing protein n=1 Tax=Hibiscus sabdariffa TaxID=183260 RepID=A0ABR2TY35_9ROSI